MLSRLTPQIIKLLHDSRDPITVFIFDSPGGQAEIMQAILKLVKQTDQDNNPPCHLITVVTAKAQSAAADLLSSGDYCIAYPDSTLLYHGVRMQSLLPVLQPFTTERTSLLAHFMRLTNDAYAAGLARNSEHRFLLRYVLLRPEFAKFKESQAPKAVTDFECFLGALKTKLSTNAHKVLKKAQERYDVYEPLLQKLIAKENTRTGPTVPAKTDAVRIKEIVDFQLKKHKADISWSFKDGGLSRLVEDFYLIAEYIDTQQSERLKNWCLRIGRMTLSKEDQAELDKISDKALRDEKLIEKVGPPTQPILTFFIALCHALQEEDNILSAMDAYWLGLVDEIWGNSDLFNSRFFGEYEEDKPEAQKDGTTAA